MGQTVEWTEKRMNSYPEIDLNMEGVETEGQKSIFWENEAEKRKITYIVMGGGPWEETWVKILILANTDKLFDSEMMRVEVSKNTSTGVISKAVFVDVFKFDGGTGRTASFAYPMDNDGKIEEVGRITNRSQGEVEDYIETLTTERIRAIDDLPERIDVEETIRLFLEQLEERRMTLPVLIPA